MIRHILLIQFKSTTTTSQIDEIKGLYEVLPNKVEGVVAVEWGLNNSPENINQGFTHSILMTFTNEQGRQNYLSHPEHEFIKGIFAPQVEDLIVFDYQV